ncbi:MAG: tRNA pseudouridine(55) synthase TruB [Actinomycetota bacterium]|nr:tRNA pseudouridine(55) synthase TruB [Actinomycetota bacterium]
MSRVHGFLLIDKPQAWTSHDVVAKVRGIVGQKKVGHAGTLDPMATGLLVVALGKVTRLLRFVQEAPKEYLATARFGVATDTLDADGAVLSREEMDVDGSDVAAVMGRFTGPILQTPPMVSARRVGGRRLYAMARQGVEVERQARPVTIHALDLVDFAPCHYPEVTFSVRCSTGTYIRTLADDMAQALGGRAHLIALRRTANGSHRVEAAHPIEAVAAAAEAGKVDDLVLPPAAGLPDLPLFTVDAATAQGVRRGMAFPRAALGDEAAGDGVVRVVDDAGTLLAVYALEGARARPEVVLP